MTCRGEEGLVPMALAQKEGRSMRQVRRYSVRHPRIWGHLAFWISRRLGMGWVFVPSLTNQLTSLPSIANGRGVYRPGVSGGRIRGGKLPDCTFKLLAVVPSPCVNWNKPILQSTEVGLVVGSKAQYGLVLGWVAEWMLEFLPSCESQARTR